ncbi:hypothetical protein EVAR_33426_1 [Eumeta japonica]|uniref:Uncharacterized protein n=1 Tax=Eumeta variegata TaxID=151549 RepID=A0A4C1W119_EUMVA|nr:hypothetical protein EVAR_33426_1 [Eumeta japonica]
MTNEKKPENKPLFKNPENAENSVVTGRKFGATALSVSVKCIDYATGCAGGVLTIVRIQVIVESQSSSLSPKCSDKVARRSLWLNG